MDPKLVATGTESPQIGKPPAATPDCVEPVLAALRRLIHATRLVERQVERRSGLTGAQLLALGQLAAAPGVSLGQLAERTATDASSISVVVARLGAMGLVRRERDPADARRAMLHATEAGLERLARTADGPDARLRPALGDLEVSDRRRLADWLEALAAAVAAPPARTPADE